MKIFLILTSVFITGALIASPENRVKEVPGIVKYEPELSYPEANLNPFGGDVKYRQRQPTQPAKKPVKVAVNQSFAEFPALAPGQFNPSPPSGLVCVWHGGGFRLYNKDKNQFLYKNSGKFSSKEKCLYVLERTRGNLICSSYGDSGYYLANILSNIQYGQIFSFRNDCIRSLKNLRSTSAHSSKALICVKDTIGYVPLLLSSRRIIGRSGSHSTFEDCLTAISHPINSQLCVYSNNEYGYEIYNLNGTRKRPYGFKSFSRCLDDLKKS